MHTNDTKMLGNLEPQNSENRKIVLFLIGVNIHKKLPVLKLGKKKVNSVAAQKIFHDDEHRERGTTL